MKILSKRRSIFFQKRLFKRDYMQDQKKHKFALIQFKTGEVAEENHERAEKHVREAASNGADLILLPEFYSCMLSKEKMQEQIQPVPGPLSERWSKVAKELNVWILSGSMLEKGTEEGKCRNTALLFNRKGELVAKYSKIHLFDVEVPGVVSYHESALIEAGREVVVADTEFGKMGLSICYGLDFFISAIICAHSLLCLQWKTSGSLNSLGLLWTRERT